MRDNLNRVQQYLLSFGYPRGIVKEYRSNSKHYRQEVSDYGNSTISGDRIFGRRERNKANQL